MEREDLVMGDQGTFNLQLEQRVKRVKRSLEGWREGVLAAHDVLVWERQWHGAALFAVSTAVFGLLWLCEPSLLTGLSMAGLVLCLADYCGAPLCAALLKPRVGPWTAAHERRLDELCRALVLHYTHSSTACASFWLLRRVRPRVFYAVVGGLLCGLAWLGCAVHNLVLSWLLVTAGLLLPGLRARQLLHPPCLASSLSDAFMHLLVQKRKHD